MSHANPFFLTFGGSIDFILQTLMAGGTTVIAGVTNLIPRLCVRFMDLCHCGNVQEVQRIQAIVARADWPAIKGGFVAVRSALQLYQSYRELSQPCVCGVFKTGSPGHQGEHSRVH